jgi:hypothetical protein
MQAKVLLQSQNQPLTEIDALIERRTVELKEQRTTEDPKAQAEAATIELLNQIQSQREGEDA